MEIKCVQLEDEDALVLNWLAPFFVTATSQRNAKIGGLKQLLNNVMMMKMRMMTRSMIGMNQYTSRADHIITMHLF